MSFANVIVLDTCILMNLGNIDRFGLLGRMSGIDWVFLDEAQGEMRHGEAIPRFNDARVRGWIRRVELTDLGGLQRFAVLRSLVGVGEAQALAYAECMNATLGTDDKRKPLSKLVTEFLPPERLIGTVDIYLAFLDRGLITVQEADRDKAELRSKRFYMNFATFAGMTSRVKL